MPNDQSKSYWIDHSVFETNIFFYHHDQGTAVFNSGKKTANCGARW